MKIINDRADAFTMKFLRKKTEDSNIRESKKQVRKKKGNKKIHEKRQKF